MEPVLDAAAAAAEAEYERTKKVMRQLALAGQFDVIRERYGEAGERKARRYIEKKQREAGGRQKEDGSAPAEDVVHGGGEAESREPSTTEKAKRDPSASVALHDKAHPAPVELAHTLHAAQDEPSGDGSGGAAATSFAAAYAHGGEEEGAAGARAAASPPPKHTLAKRKRKAGLTLGQKKPAVELPGSEDAVVERAGGGQQEEEEEGGEGDGVQPPSLPAPAATVKVKKARKAAPAPGGAPTVKATGAGGGGAIKPKRESTGPTSYVLFAKAARPALVAAEPAFTFAELGKRLGEMWRALSPEEKAPYVAQAEEARAALALAAASALLALPRGVGEGAEDDVESAFPPFPLPVPTPAGVLQAGKGKGKKALAVPGPAKLAKAAPAKKKKPVKLLARTDEEDDEGSDVSESGRGGAGVEPWGVAPGGAASGESGTADSGVAALSTSHPPAAAKPRSRKSGAKRRRGRRGEDAGGCSSEEEGEATDEDDVILYKDARSTALAEAEARKASGLQVKKRGGYVDESEGKLTPLPRLTGKFDYRPYTPLAGGMAALVLPAYGEWRQAVADAAVEGGPGSDAHRVHAFLSLLEATRRVTSALDSLLPCTTGVLLGRVVALERVAAGAGVGVGLVASTSSSSAPPSSSVEADAFDDGASMSGSQHGGSSALAVTTASSNRTPARSRERAWHLLTLRLSTSATTRGAFLPPPPAESEEGEGGGASGEDGMQVEGGRGEEERAVSQSHPPVEVDDWAGPTVTIPWLPPQDPCVKTFFLLTGEAYARAMGADLRPGTQVRALFSVDGQPSKVEFVEGRVYARQARKEDKARGWTACPYNALSAVWYNQLAEDPGTWFLEEWQTNNAVSPWEVTCDALPFVLNSHVHHFAMETPGLPSPTSVLDYLLTTEASTPFRDPVSKHEPWAAAYHARIKAPVDLSTLRKKAGAGGSSTPAPGGVEALWEDLRLLIKNAKTFNAPDALVWRQADELQAEVRRLRKAYTGYGAGGAGAQKKARTTSNGSGPVFSFSTMVVDGGYDSDASSVGYRGGQDDVDEEVEQELMQAEVGGASFVGMPGLGGVRAHAPRPVSAPLRGRAVPAELRTTTAVTLADDEDMDLDELSQGSSSAY